MHYSRSSRRLSWYITVVSFRSFSFLLPFAIIIWAKRQQILPYPADEQPASLEVRIVVLKTGCALYDRECQVGEAKVILWGRLRSSPGAMHTETKRFYVLL